MVCESRFKGRHGAVSRGAFVAERQRLARVALHVQKLLDDAGLL